MGRLKYYSDWLFRDLSVRNGPYVIAEAPNLPLVGFCILIIIAIASRPGWVQTVFSLLAYAILAYWSFLEIKSGRSRFRRLLGCIGLLAAIGALLLGLGI